MIGWVKLEIGNFQKVGNFFSFGIQLRCLCLSELFITHPCLALPLTSPIYYRIEVTSIDSERQF